MGENSNPIVADVISWVEEFVTQRHPLLGGFPPCPYAKKAMLAQKVFWKVSDGLDQKSATSAIAECVTAVNSGQFEVAIVIEPRHELWPVIELNRFVEGWRLENKPRDLYLLRDHPKDVEIINRVQMNQGKYLLFFVQKASALTAARRELESQGYYTKWSDDDIHTVVGHDL